MYGGLSSLGQGFINKSGILMFHKFRLESGLWCFWLVVKPPAKRRKLCQLGKIDTL